MSKWGSGRNGSIHLDDLPNRVKEDINKYMQEEARADEADKVVDEQSAKEYIERTLSRKQPLQPFVKEFSSADYARIIDGDHIKSLISKNKIDRAGLNRPLDKGALKDAQEFELKRGGRARKVDESRDARRIKPVTRANVTRWKKQPGKMDIAGVDTRFRHPRVGARGRVLTPKRRSRWVRYVSSRGNYYIYRDQKGRFISNPERGRRKS